MKITSIRVHISALSRISSISSMMFYEVLPSGGKTAAPKRPRKHLTLQLQHSPTPPQK